MADQQAEGAERRDREEKELHPPEPAHHVQGHFPGRRAGGDPAEEVDSRQHPGVGVEDAQIGQPRCQVGEQKQTEQDAEERQGPQVEAEALLPAAEQAPEPGGSGIRG